MSKGNHLSPPRCSTELREDNVQLKNYIMSLFILKNDSSLSTTVIIVSFIHPEHFLIFILCFNLCFQFSFLFLAMWKEKHYHMWALLHSQMILICMRTVNLMDFWKCQPNNMRTCIPSFAFPSGERKDRQKAGIWSVCDSCSCLRTACFQKTAQPARGGGAG